MSAATQLEQLAKFTVIVADTGDIDTIKKLKPTDATTNPSLLYKAAEMKQYSALVDDAVAHGLKEAADSGDAKFNTVESVMLKLAVNFGAEITKIVPGVVSTEVDARLSFDTAGTITQARRLIDLYKSIGIDKSRVLIKISSTWEGIKAAEQLQKEGIHCNLTLLFSMAQAIACAEAGVTLISPFVGRIFDWHVKANPSAKFTPDQDPGVKSVRAIYEYYKAHDYKTIIMGASFRNVGQILALAGCDKLTIGPALIEEMKNSTATVTRALNSEVKTKPTQLHLDEKTFRWMHNEDQMATEKLSEGIRLFTADSIKLEKIIEAKLANKSKL